MAEWNKQDPNRTVYIRISYLGCMNGDENPITYNPCVRWCQLTFNGLCPIKKAKELNGNDAKVFDCTDYTAYMANS